MESENDKLKRELNEMKSKYLESQKRNFALQEENRAIAHSLQKAHADKIKTKTEVSELKKTISMMGGVKKVGFGSRMRKWLQSNFNFRP